MTNILNYRQHGPRWAHIISDIFSPLLIPTYGMILAMWITPMRSLPEGNRIFATIMVAIITGAMPFAMLMALSRIGKVSDLAISNRAERFVPMSVAAVCYAAAGLLMTCYSAPIWLRMFFFGAAIATAIAVLITLRWKISAHTTALGGLGGMMLWCAVNGLADVSSMIVISSIFIISGLVATTRLLLCRHTFWQVVAGFFLGLIICYSAMYIH
jgi:hypothetical protein